MTTSKNPLDAVLEDLFGKSGFFASPIKNASDLIDPFLTIKLDHKLLAVDVTVDDEQVVVQADAPGRTLEELDIEVLNGILTITVAGRKESEASASATAAPSTVVLRKRDTAERSVSLPLPRYSQEDKLRAVFTNGVLTVTVPRTPKPQPVKVTVEQE